MLSSNADMKQVKSFTAIHFSLLCATIHAQCSYKKFNTLLQE